MKNLQLRQSEEIGQHTDIPKAKDGTGLRIDKITHLVISAVHQSQFKPILCWVDR